MKFVLQMVLCAFVFVTGADAATVTKVSGNDIYVNMGKAKGVQIGTMMNVYRKKDVETEYGSMKFTTQIFIGRIFSYKVSENHTVARVREMTGVIEDDTKKAVLNGDLAQPAFVVEADDLFRRGETDLIASAVPTLRRMASFIKRFKVLKVRIEAHTDSDTNGSVKLSRTQAKSIREWLVQNEGLKADDLVAVGYGDQKPIADNSTSAGQKSNRRIEIVIED